MTSNEASETPPRRSRPKRSSTPNSVQSKLNTSSGRGEDFLLPWSTFSNERIFGYLESIHQFVLSIQFPQFNAWNDTKQMRSVQDRLYEEMYELLFRAGLYRYDDLKRVEAANSVGVEFNETDHEFAIHATLSNKLSLIRPGSSFERFYSWYKNVMPHVGAVFSAVKSQLENEARRGRDDVKAISPAIGDYSFTFVLYDFYRGAAGRGPRIKNSHLLRRALTHVPGPDGRLVELSDGQLPNLGRIDLSISRWQDTPSGPVREIYNIQAPGNRDYGVLWARFDYIAETPVDAQGKAVRTQPDFPMFLSRFDFPINEFLRDRALAGFLTELTDGLNFKATPGTLP